MQPSATITQQGGSLIDKTWRLIYRVGETGNSRGRVYVCKQCQKQMLQCIYSIPDKIENVLKTQVPRPYANVYEHRFWRPEVHLVNVCR